MCTWLCCCVDTVFCTCKCFMCIKHICLLNKNIWCNFKKETTIRKFLENDKLSLIKEQLKKDEGYKNKVYKNPLDESTRKFGYGHLIIQNDDELPIGSPVSEERIQLAFKTDVEVKSLNALICHSWELLHFGHFYTLGFAQNITLKLQDVSTRNVSWEVVQCF